ncbi:hypothetical protein BP6252_13239 [Coleophoma cylindrospora]|uniref:Heterokaryon incompatibility domain-containing protein n=1 Tax=Coleophoma cylindrospora TaxID=1849047 RepID=A0A3D8QA93_9HELO|nr:hypothetical protein BP6252_13239 [Coleophoma cylindrospora]
MDMNSEQSTTRAYAHIASAVNSCSERVKACTKTPEARDKYLLKYLDSQQDFEIDLNEVMNVVYWMAKIQARRGIGPRKFGHWVRMLPYEINLPPVGQALKVMETDGFNICKNRLWKLVDASDRKQDDLPDIVKALKTPQGKSRLDQLGHELCTANKCQQAHKDAGDMQQLHKCSETRQECERQAVKFPVEHLLTALEQEEDTAWHWPYKPPADWTPGLIQRGEEKYMAISHVWGDGTGASKREPGTVNRCLFDYFASISKEVGCIAIWWDVVSIPTGNPDARSKALEKMHHNYARAACTIVHDLSLLSIPWTDDGMPCLALVLSSWFTRAWTALELLLSNKVKILFKPGQDGKPVLKDLDEDVLAKRPESSSRAHWLATVLTQQLREPIENVGDLLAILSPRSTSFVRDRTKVAALLAGVPHCDFGKDESYITQLIIKYLGKIPYTCLLHGKPTMTIRGGFSWCAATLDDMPVDVSKDIGDESETKYLDIDQGGAAEGEWLCRSLNEADPEKIHPYGDDLSSHVKVQVALRDWKNCLLLKVDGTGNELLALLVTPLHTVTLKRGRMLKCRYVGVVLEEVQKEAREEAQEEPSGNETQNLWNSYLVRIGGHDGGGAEPISGKDALERMRSELGPREVEDAPIVDYDPDAEDRMKRSQSSASRDLDVGEHARDHNFALLDPPQPWALLNPVSEPDSTHLKQAVLKENRKAMRWLVRNGLSLRQDELEDIILQRTSAGRAMNLKGITILGDILAEQKPKWDQAIKIYLFANNKYERAANVNTLDKFRLKQSLGSVYLKKAAIESGKRTDLNDAEDLLKDVLRACDEARLQQAKAKAEFANGAKIYPDARTSSNRPSGQKKEVTKDQAVKKRAQKAAEKIRQLDDAWFRLELKAIADLALLYIGQYEFERAAEVYRRPFRAEGDVLPPENEVFRVLWNNREMEPYEKKDRDPRAARLYKSALQNFSTMFHEKHLLVLLTTLHLGVNYMLQATKVRDAEKLLRHAEVGLEAYCEPNLDHPIVQLAKYHRGILCMRRGYGEEAEKMLNAVRPGTVDLRGLRSKDHWLTPAAMCALGQNALLQNDFQKAQSLYQEVLRVYHKAIPVKATSKPNDNIPDTIVSIIMQTYVGLASAYHQNKNKADKVDAVALCERMLETLKERYRHRQIQFHLQECETLELLSGIYKDEGRFGKAKDAAQQALNGFEHLDGHRSFGYLRAMEKLAILDQEEGKLQEAETRWIQVVDGYSEALGPHHEKALRARWQLGSLYLSRRKLKDAEAACSEAYKGLDQTLGPDNPLTMRAARTLGEVYRSNGKYREATHMFTRYNQFTCHSTAGNPTEHNEHAKARSAVDLGEVVGLVDDPRHRDEATKWFQTALNILLTMKPSYDLYDAQLRFGRLHKQRGRFDDANQYLKLSFNGFNQLKYSDRALEAALVWGHTKLLKREADARSWIESAYAQIQGKSEINIFVKLEACMVYGELRLMSKEMMAQGAVDLKEVLRRYEADAGLPGGHPTRIRIMDRLIKHYSSQGNSSEADAMRISKFDALVTAYGEDEANMIMHMTESTVSPTLYRRSEKHGGRQELSTHQHPLAFRQPHLKR